MTIFFRLLDDDDKGTALQEAVAALPQNPTTEAFAVNPESFEQVPGAPFAYWVGEKIRRCFEQLDNLEGEFRTAKQGVATADDFRFIRTAWEVYAQISVKSGFYPFAKGGIFSPFYANIYLVINWQKQGSEIANFSKAYIRNPDFYFRPGLTWPLRTTSGLSMRLMPSNCIFGHKGPSIFIHKNLPDKILSLAAIANGKAFQILIAVQLAAADAGVVT